MYCVFGKFLFDTPKMQSTRSAIQTRTQRCIVQLPNLQLLAFGNEFTALQLLALWLGHRSRFIGLLGGWGADAGGRLHENPALSWANVLTLVRVASTLQVIPVLQLTAWLLGHRSRFGDLSVN